MDMRAPRRVADLVASAVPQIGPRLLEARVRTRWSSVVGREIARRTQPGRLEQGCLTVTVDNSPWLQELTLRQAELTARLTETFPEVRALRFAMGTLTREAGVTRVSRPRTDPLTAAELRDIDDAVSVIADADVASSARRLLATARRSSPLRGAG